MTAPSLNAFQRHVLIGNAIRLRGGSATPRQIGECTGLDLTTIHRDLADMMLEKTIVRVRDDNYAPGQTKTSRFVYSLAA